jgi:hypothetical protein
MSKFPMVIAAAHLGVEDKAARRIVGKLRETRTGMEGAVCGCDVASRRIA